MTTLGLDTGFCALWPHVATAAQLCPGQLNYQPFHRDLDELMAFCKERKPKFDAGLIFETSVIWARLGDEPVTAGTGHFYDIVWSWIESQGQESEVCGWENQGKGSGLREWRNMEKTICNGWNLGAETCRDAGMLGKATASEKKNHCQGNHPWYERPTKMLGLFRTWSRAVRGRSRKVASATWVLRASAQS